VAHVSLICDNNTVNTPTNATLASEVKRTLIGPRRKTITGRDVTRISRDDGALVGLHLASQIQPRGKVVRLSSRQDAR
jgi:hypothetical protein